MWENYVNHFKTLSQDHPAKTQLAMLKELKKLSDMLMLMIKLPCMPAVD
jgi:hypothetical protein